MLSMWHFCTHNAPVLLPKQHFNLYYFFINAMNVKTGLPAIVHCDLTSVRILLQLVVRPGPGSVHHINFDDTYLTYARNQFKDSGAAFRSLERHRKADMAMDCALWATHSTFSEGKQTAHFGMMCGPSTCLPLIPSKVTPLALRMR